MEYLTYFEVVSCGGWLNINLEKSELIIVGEVSPLEVLASLLGYGVRNLPSICIGFLLSALFKSSSVWDMLEERFHKQVGFLEEPVALQEWKINPFKEYIVELV